MRRLFPIVMLLLAVSTVEAQTAKKPEAPKRVRHTRRVAKDPHTVSMIAVQPGVRLEVIDWTGKGTPLVFLAGLGNTGHVFDDFAPQFADKHHVYAITRRGFGASDMPTAGYDAVRLAADIAAVLDSLHIKSAYLAGHSIAGDELTAFATAYPERTLGLIYLDAAYDHSPIGELMKSFPGPSNYLTQERTANVPVANLRELIDYAYSVRVPLNELYQTVNVDRNGVAHGDRRNAAPQVIAAVKPISYSKVSAPVLAVFAIPDSARNMAPNRFADLDAKDRALLDGQFGAFRDFQRTNLARVRKELPRARVVELHNAHHYVFISNARQTEDEMRMFMQDERKPQ